MALPTNKTLTINPSSPLQARNLRYQYCKSKVVQLGYYKGLIDLEKKLISDKLQEKKIARRKED